MLPWMERGAASTSIRRQSLSALRIAGSRSIKRLRRTIGEHLRAGTTRSLPSSQRSALARVLSERKKETLLACRKLTQGTGAAADEAVDFDVHVDALEQQFAMLLTKHLRSC